MMISPLGKQETWPWGKEGASLLPSLTSLRRVNWTPHK